MKITDRIHIVASGAAGFSMTNPFDCTVYLLDGGGELALIDTGAGVEPQRIIYNINRAGYSPAGITKIFLTHGHGDHSGGASALREYTGARVMAMSDTARFVREGNLNALSVKEAAYGPGYRYAPCQVEGIGDGEQIKVGEVLLTALLTEGHSAGHASYLLEEKGRKTLFAGDSIMYGGMISLQSTWDCDLQKYIQTVKRLSELRVDTFLPSHLTFSINDGWQQIDKAMSGLRNFGIPKNMIGEF